MTVLDHYGHHGCMHTLSLTTRTGRATSEVGDCLGISSLMCIPPNFEITLATRTRRATTWVGIWKSNMTSKLLESVHVRMNSLLVCNLYNTLYEVSNVYWFVSFGACDDVVTWRLASWLQAGRMCEDSKFRTCNRVDYHIRVYAILSFELNHLY